MKWWGEEACKEKVRAGRGQGEGEGRREEVYLGELCLGCAVEALLGWESRLRVGRRIGSGAGEGLADRCTLHRVHFKFRARGMG